MRENARVTPIEPRSRLQARGMSRDPVGGVANSGAFSSTSDAARGVFAHDGSAVTERGLTYSLNVTNVSAEILPMNLNRKFIFIQNNAVAGTVTVSFGGAGAVLGVGFNLAAGGGSLYMDNACLTARVFVVGSIASNPNVSMVTG
jgi:hypothetical protein